MKPLKFKPGEKPPYKPPRLRKLTLGKTKITIFQSVKGLVSERRMVAAAVKKIKPECIGLGIAASEIKGLTTLLNEAEEKPEFFLSSFEQVYAYGLAFQAERQEDKVELPPPSFEQAVKEGLELEISLEGLDLDDEGYTEAYIKHITRWQWIRQEARVRKLEKRPWAAVTPSEFALEFDEALCALPGYGALEAARESAMTQSLMSLAEDYQTILAVIELPRVAGVVEKLDD